MIAKKWEGCRLDADRKESAKVATAGTVVIRKDDDGESEPVMTGSCPERDLKEDDGTVIDRLTCNGERIKSETVAD
jgi:hypothetical protein